MINLWNIKCLSFVSKENFQDLGRIYLDLGDMYVEIRQYQNALDNFSTALINQIKKNDIKF